jgi:hypothetical protein
MASSICCVWVSLCLSALVPVWYVSCVWSFSRLYDGLVPVWSICRVWYLIGSSLPCLIPVWPVFCVASICLVYLLCLVPV